MDGTNWRLLGEDTLEGGLGGTFSNSSAQTHAEAHLVGGGAFSTK